MTDIPDFGLAGLRWDLRDKLGGACELCGVESDTKVCAGCEAFRRGVAAERERVTRIIRRARPASRPEAMQIAYRDGFYSALVFVLGALGVEDTEEHQQ